MRNKRILDDKKIILVGRKGSGKNTVAEVAGVPGVTLRDYYLRYLFLTGVTSNGDDFKGSFSTYLQKHQHLKGETLTYRLLERFELENFSAVNGFIKSPINWTYLVGVSGIEELKHIKHLRDDSGEYEDTFHPIFVWVDDSIRTKTPLTESEAEMRKEADYIFNNNAGINQIGDSIVGLLAKAAISNFSKK